MTERKPDPLAEAKRIMGNLARMPHKPHAPLGKKARSSPGAKAKRQSSKEPRPGRE